MAKILILGGTTEARNVSEALAKSHIPLVLSLAGVIKGVIPPNINTRVGGFGGAEAMASYISAEKFTHVVDATHPFAAQISRHAIIACQCSGVPLLVYTRPPWVAQKGDNWLVADNIQDAVGLLPQKPSRVFLTIGRKFMALFAKEKHFFLIRTIEPIVNNPGFSQFYAITERGPFALEAEIELIKKHQISILVTKNSGGATSGAKIAAARLMNITVIMINRPKQDAASEITYSLERALEFCLSNK